MKLKQYINFFSWAQWSNEKGCNVTISTHNKSVP
jgi:hypothetical protein